MRQGVDRLASVADSDERMFSLLQNVNRQALIDGIDASLLGGLCLLATSAWLLRSRPTPQRTRLIVAVGALAFGACVLVSAYVANRAVG